MIVSAILWDCDIPIKAILLLNRAVNTAYHYKIEGYQNEKALALLMVIAIVLSLAACGAKTEKSNEKTTGGETASTPAASGKSLVVYFSRTGEQDKVGVIEKGNTKIVAEMIAEKVGADTFEIVPFCTHEGSADANTQKKIQTAVPKASVKEVLAVRGQDAQKDKDSVKKQIEDWLK